MLRSVLPELHASSSFAARRTLHASSTAAAQLARFRTHGSTKSKARIQKLGPFWKRERFSREEAPHANLAPEPRNNRESPPPRKQRRPLPRADERGETSWSRRIRGEETEEGRPRGSRDRAVDPYLANAVDASVRSTHGEAEQRTYRTDPRAARLSRPPKPTNAPAKKVKNDLTDSEFSKAKTISDEVAQFGQSFTSPPLLPGLLSCLEEMIGVNATPTPIQASSLTWLLNNHNKPESGFQQFLLASETGSGKSIAYLLPLLQHLKVAEIEQRRSGRSEENTEHTDPSLERELMPKALILAPTHELSRQLSKTAKSLLHEVKLRVRCASQANMKNTKQQDFTARQLAAQLDGADDGSGMFDVRRKKIPVDVLVGTPMKVMEMYKGRGWNRQEEESGEAEAEGEHGVSRSTRFERAPRTPPLGLQNIEWVVVDEADVLFDPDFEQTTRQLLADISEARGQPVQYATTSSLSLDSASAEETTSTPTTTAVNYPFNFILTSATIPSALARYLDECHPNLIRLASPRLHALPKLLKTEYVGWTGGNKNADIERRIRQVWAEDSISPENKGLSKILIFCNKNTKIDDLASYLEDKGIKNIALSRDSDQRKWGNNHHLDGFVRLKNEKNEGESAEVVEEVTDSDPKTTPHVMITTSLLSRGIDFSPSVKHVFIVDEPRNMIDFLHRAGRTGRAGEGGKVVIFGRMQGRGSLKSKEVRKKVNLLSMVR